MSQFTSQHKRAISLYSTGEKAKDILKDIEISREKLYDLIEKSENVELKRRDRVIKRYIEGEPVMDILNKEDISRTSLYRYIKNAPDLELRDNRRGNSSPGKKYSYEEKQKAIHMYQQLSSEQGKKYKYNVQEILDEIGMSRDYFYKLLGDWGIEKRQPTNQSHKIINNPEKKERIIQEVIEENRPPVQVAKNHNISREAIYQTVNRYKIVEDYKQGKSPLKIMKTYNVSANQLYNLLEAEGVKIREEEMELREKVQRGKQVSKKEVEKLIG